MTSFNFAAFAAVLLFSLAFWATGLNGRPFRVLARVAWGLGWVAAWLTVGRAMDLPGLNILGILWIVGASLFAFITVSEKIKKAGGFR